MCKIARLYGVSKGRFWKVCLFVCGISLTSGQLINELFPDCTRSCFCKLLYAAGALTASMR